MIIEDSTYIGRESHVVGTGLLFQRAETVGRSKKGMATNLNLLWYNCVHEDVHTPAWLALCMQPVNEALNSLVT